MATFEQRGTKWRARVRVKGQAEETRTFKLKADALRWARGIEEDMAHGRHASDAAARRHTFAELVERYLASLPENYATREAVARMLAWWSERLGPVSVADVKPDRIAALRDELAREEIRPAEGCTVRRPATRRGPATIRRYLAALSVALGYAMKPEIGWLEVNPVARVEKPREPRGRVRYLDDDERERLLAACAQSPLGPPLVALVTLALTTGARRGELLGLRWQDVDFKEGVLRLEHTKNGERRSLPLVEPSRAQLAELKRTRRLDSPFVFAHQRDGKKPAGYLTEGPWYQVLHVAGIEDFRFHDLRHSAASYLAMQGASLIEIGQVLGHKSPAMTLRYSHLNTKHAQGLMGRMAAKIFGEPAS